MFGGSWSVQWGRHKWKNDLNEKMVDRDDLDQDVCIVPASLPAMCHMNDGRCSPLREAPEQEHVRNVIE